MTTEALPERDLSQGEPRNIGSLDGTVQLHIDTENEDYWIQAKPDYSPKSMCSILSQADWWGLEEMDDEECEPDIMPDGSIRRYLAAKPSPDYKVVLRVVR